MSSVEREQPGARYPATSPHQRAARARRPHARGSRSPARDAQDRHLALGNGPLGAARRGYGEGCARARRGDLCALRGGVISTHPHAGPIVELAAFGQRLITSDEVGFCAKPRQCAERLVCGAAGLNPVWRQKPDERLAFPSGAHATAGIATPPPRAGGFVPIASPHRDADGERRPDGRSARQYQRREGSS